MRLMCDAMRIDCMSRRMLTAAASRTIVRSRKAIQQRRRDLRG
jgi:hypothetical protein